MIASGMRPLAKISGYQSQARPSKQQFKVLYTAMDIIHLCRGNASRPHRRSAGAPTWRLSKDAALKRTVLGQGQDERIRDLAATAPKYLVCDGQSLAKASMPASVTLPHLYVRFFAKASMLTSVTMPQLLKTTFVDDGQFFAKASMPTSVTLSQLSKYTVVNAVQFLAKASMPASVTCRNWSTLHS
jgi:hypothetical protein